jgi:hypothetical protein
MSEKDNSTNYTVQKNKMEVKDVVHVGTPARLKTVKSRECNTSQDTWTSGRLVRD